MAKLVTVNSYSSRTEAEIAKGLLESNGIKSVIISDDAGGMYPFPMASKFGVELKISEKDLVKAKELLDQAT